MRLMKRLSIVLAIAALVGFAATSLTGCPSGGKRGDGHGDHSH